MLPPSSITIFLDTEKSNSNQIWVPVINNVTQWTEILRARKQDLHHVQNSALTSFCGGMKPMERSQKTPCLGKSGWEQEIVQWDQEIYFLASTVPSSMFTAAGGESVRGSRATLCSWVPHSSTALLPTLVFSVHPNKWLWWKLCDAPETRGEEAGRPVGASHRTLLKATYKETQHYMSSEQIPHKQKSW